MIEALAELVFGRDGDGAQCLLHGWSEPEDEFTWSVGHESRLRIPLPPARPDESLILDLDVSPFLFPGGMDGQRLVVSVNGIVLGDDQIAGGGSLAWRIPPAALAGSRTLLVDLQHPQARRPVDLGLSGDTRQLGFMLHSATVLAVPPEPAFKPTVLPPLDLPKDAPTHALTAALRNCTGMTTLDLMLSFESLGHNCEFGIVQRHCGAEPLGLLRFVAITLPDLLRGLDCGFAGVGDARWVSVSVHPGPRPEFMVRDVRHNISFHSFRYADETTADIVAAEQSRQLEFFHRNFMEVLQSGERLFVFQRGGQLLAAQMLPLLTLLRHHGPNALLYVTEGGPYPPGTVEQIGHGFYHGHISRMAPGEDVGQCDLRAWLSVCANAYLLWRGDMSGP